MVSLGSLGVLVVAALRLSGEAARDQAEDHVSSAAAASAVAVQQEMQGLVDVVDAFAGRPSLRAAVSGGEASTVDREQLRFQLGALREARAGISLVFYADVRGVVADVLPVSPDVVGRDFSHRDWYRGVQASGRSYASEVYETAAAGGGLVVAAAAPVRAGLPGSPMNGILVTGPRPSSCRG
ncbi:MAG: PDC sensor domain-containing protein [Acidimicrobiales bacterium]